MSFQHKTEPSKKLLELLRKIREENNLTQVVLAERLGTPQSFISKYESGHRRLDILEIRQICFAIGISMADFIQQLEEILNESE